MEILRFVVSGLFALIWLAITVGNLRLAWLHLTRQGRIGSFMSLGAFVAGSLAIIAFPVGTLGSRAPWILVPLVLDAGIILLAAYGVSQLLAKVRGGKSGE